jgi:hypothetical protein
MRFMEKRVPKNAHRNVRVKSCIAALSNLLQSPLFSKWPLHVHFVAEEMHRKWSIELQEFQTRYQRNITFGPLRPILINLKDYKIDIRPKFCQICFEETDEKGELLRCLPSKLELQCPMRAHLLCWAECWTSDHEILPIEGKCPGCNQQIYWGDLIRDWKLRVAASGKTPAQNECAQLLGFQTDRSSEEESYSSEIDGVHVDIQSTTRHHANSPNTNEGTSKQIATIVLSETDSENSSVLKKSSSCHWQNILSTNEAQELTERVGRLSFRPTPQYG